MLYIEDCENLGGKPIFNFLIKTERLFLNYFINNQIYMVCIEHVLGTPYVHQGAYVEFGWQMGLQGQDYTTTLLKVLIN